MAFCKCYDCPLRKHPGNSFKRCMESHWMAISRFLSARSFRTGVIVLISCILLYLLSFLQLLLPISAAWKSTLWVLLFGLAKVAQYTGLLILGSEGVKRLKCWWKNR